MKFRNYIGSITLSVIAASSMSVMAEEIKLGSGGETGNYFSMVEDINSYCGKLVGEGNSLVNMASKASVANLVGMTNKLYHAGFVQEDVLQYYGKRDPSNYNSNRLKVVSPLHVESAHLLIPKGFTPKTGQRDWKLMAQDWLSDKPEKTQFSVDMLKGQTIGAWGGSVVSAEALSYFLKLNMNVTTIEESSAKTADIPLLLVGGQPYKPVEELLKTGRWDLVPINVDQLKASAPFYIASDVNYVIGGKVKTVKTFGVRALLVGKSFRRESKNAPLTSLASCIDDAVIDLADDNDTNPNWASVYEAKEQNIQSNWAYFPLK